MKQLKIFGPICLLNWEVVEIFNLFFDRRPGWGCVVLHKESKVVSVPEYYYLSWSMNVHRIPLRKRVGYFKFWGLSIEV